MNRKRQFILVVVLACMVIPLAQSFRAKKPIRRQQDATLTAAKRTAKFATRIRQPDGPSRVQLQVHGQTLQVSCSHCHSIRKPNWSNNESPRLKEFHGQLKFNHGSVGCFSCHNPNGYDQLRLADGKPISFGNVMTLCSQCHGPQARDYRHGAHGGMTGYWDRSRGPRQKNNCIDCHNPHVPQFPKMKPTFKSRDRFLKSVVKKHSS